ncbi:adenosylcobinamide-GDP ribazoletransferase [Methylocystis sp. ATCC 49242]|uniref:adenosylcobinamide-GDP ribazoletransferase n=1 Tax=Methylocystis sp. ATCC 49242 TaxID=622637 RepID=UPI0003111D4A|nr:adenosylcobinamide-GDP ribazoletransferase [Methylocystis sp. ATCC 49242]
MMQRIIQDVRACLQFYSRLPVAGANDAHNAPDFSRVGWAAPIGGAIIGGIGGAVILVAQPLHLPTTVTAACAVAALAFTTGALHEDGLADLADGFGGGKDREAKLAIMRDSRLGSYGGLALCLSTMLRVFALAAIIERGAMLAFFAVLAAGAFSRAAGLAPMLVATPARADGAGASSAPPSSDMIRRAFVVAAALALCPLVAGASVAQIVASQLAAIIVTVALTKLAQRQIGGYTGDVLGAAQQASEIAILVALSAR